MLKLSLVIAAAALALTGCATMSESECASADWRIVGLTDGQRGEQLSKASQRAEACFKHGISLDMAAYEAGRDEGLISYCTPDRGYNLGLSGSAYNGVCLNHDEDLFLAEYESGRTYYGFQNAVRVAGQAVNKAERDLKEIDEDIENLEADFAKSEASEVPWLTTKTYTDRLADLKAEREDQLDLITELKVDERVAERDLEAYEEAQGYY